MWFLLILLSGIVMRVAFLSTSSSDDMVHLWNTRLRRLHGDFFTHKPFFSVLEGNRGYPTLSHWIISKFPQKNWRLAGKFLNIGYDCLLITAIWIVAGTMIPSSGEFPLPPGIVAAVAVSTSPLLLPINSRIKSMGGRTLGNVLVFAYLLCLYAALNGYWIPGLIGMLFFGTGTVLTSKFALQFLLLTAPFLALLTLSPLPIVGLVAVFVTILVVPGLGLREIASFMWVHSRWYMRNFYTVSSVDCRNRVEDIRKLRYYFKYKRGVFWGFFFRRSTYFIALYSFPLFWLAVSWIFSGQSLLRTGLAGFGVSVTFATCAVFFLTSLRPLLFLGQAERYFEYCLPLTSFVFASACENNTISVQASFMLILFQITMSMANLTYSHYSSVRHSLRPVKPESEHPFLDRLNGKRILSIPTKSAFLMSFHDNGTNKYYYRSVNIPHEGFSYMQKDHVWFEMPTPDLNHFRHKYDIDTVVAEKAFLRRAEDRNICYPLSCYETIYEDDRYIIIDLEQPK